VNAGEHTVVAEVVRDKDGWGDLLIRGSTVVSEKRGWLLKPNLPSQGVSRYFYQLSMEQFIKQGIYL
jgi:hypothetical protein